MRNRVYVALMASFLAIMVAFSSGVAMAVATEEMDRPAGNASMSGTTDHMTAGMQGEMSGHMRGEMSEHMQGRMPDQMKTMKSDEGKSAGSVERKAEFSGQAGAGMSSKMSPHMSGEAQARGTGREGMAMSGQSAPDVTGKPVGQGIVAGTDRPDNCLRIRRGPSMSYDVIGCANEGTTLNLTGVFSNDGRWAQLDNNGWVFVRQIKTDVKPPRSVAKRSGSWEQAAGAGSSGTSEYGSTYGDGSYYYYGWPGYYYSPGGLSRGPASFGLPPLPPLPALPPLPGPGNLLP
jgi:hypothetical protein